MVNGSSALSPPATVSVLKPVKRFVPNPRGAPWLALTLIVLAGLGLRLFGLNWDDGRDLHPDELYVAKNVLIDRISMSWPPDLANVLDPDLSGLNPRSVDPNTGEPREYPYGALPLLVTDTIATLLGGVTGDPWTAADHAYLVGRALSALLDTLTVVVVFAIASRLVSPALALVAAFFAATAPISIQLAHFFTTDAWLTFFVSVALYCAIRAAEDGSGRWFAASGFAFGLALATKGSVFALAGLIFAAVLYSGGARVQRDGDWGAALTALPKQAALAGISALLGFLLFEPYVIARPGIFIQSLRTQAEISSGNFDIPFTRIFVGTEPGIYQLEQFVRWGFGPVAGLLAILGIGILAVRFRHQPTAAAWMLLCWLVGYGVVILIADTKFLRYLAPLVPVLAITAALATGWLTAFIQRRLSLTWAAVATAVLLLGSLAWTLAFMGIYAAEHPRLSASRWIYANVAPGSRLSWEYWDDRLPKPLGPGLTEADFQYQFRAIDLYRDAPPSELRDELYTTLLDLDYIVMSSDRISAALPRLPWRYAVQSQFVARLHAGTIGFVPVAEFQVSPTLGPWTIDDRHADESFINYDHPRVTIFQKSAPLERDAFDRQMAWAIEQPWHPEREPPMPSLRLDAPVGVLPPATDFQWSAALTGSSHWAVVAWIGLLATLQIVGYQLTRHIMPRFADAGWGLARLVAILVAGYLTWLAASLQVAPFQVITAWVALGLTALAGMALARRWPLPPRAKTADAFAVGAEVVFWLVFAGFLALRLMNPDSWHPIWGGEKPMEFAHLNATLRSVNFPPYDPWFADGYLNYYYYGLYLVAYLLKLTGIPTAIGFNLAQPTVLALLAAAGFSVAATITHDLLRRRTAALIAGSLAAVLLVISGNLSTLGRLLNGPPFDFSSFLDWTWDGSRAIRAGITEFPFFTGLYADLHAHGIALPITVLVIGLAYTVARSGRALRPAPDRIGHHPDRHGRGQFIVILAVLALAIGSLFPTNAWDYPVYAALGVSSLFMATASIRDWRSRWVWLTGLSVALLGCSYVLYKPFHDHYVALFSALGPVATPTPVTEAATHIGALATITFLGLLALALPRRPLLGWAMSRPVLVLGGLSFVLMLANLAWRRESPIATTLFGLILLILAILTLIVSWPLASRLRPGMAQVVGRSAIAGALLAALAVTIAGQPVLGAYLTLLTLGFSVWTAGPTLPARFTALLVIAGAGVGAGTELFFVADDLINTTAYRMNTIFKFYNQIWILFALSGAVLLANMAARAAGIAPRHDLALTPDRVARQSWGRAGTTIAAVLIASTLLYPLFATGPRLAQRFPQPPPGPTLDGLAWMTTGTIPWFGPAGEGTLTFADDLAAIHWLTANSSGTPVIAEASIGPYRCNGSRISIATGLPTIIGWERHEQQQRPPAELGPRVRDVATLYTSPDPVVKRSIVDKYKVEFIVVGQLERYGIQPSQNGCEGFDNAAGIAAFEPMLGTDLELAFQQGETAIYRVLPIASRVDGA